MAFIRCLLCAAAACLALVTPVQAGPIELFRDALPNPLQPDNFALHYIYGGSGMFLSSDAAKTFKLLPYSGVSSDIVRDDSSVVRFGPNRIQIGVFTGLWVGDATGCSWSAVPELDGKYVAALAGDPIDPMRSYAATSNGSPALNGIWLNDGTSPTWKQLGTQEELFVNSIHVLKIGDARRFYETVVKTTMIENKYVISYFVRHSDDEGKSWVEFEFTDLGSDTTAEFIVQAIDPANPDHVVGAVKRGTEKTPDDLYSSMDQGKTWQKVGSVTEIRAVTFTPDGKMYYGDVSQDTPGLFVVDSPGDAPMQLQSMWKVGCLTWDAPRERMLACDDYYFGTVDLATGAFTSLLDMRTADAFVECPGQPPMEKIAELQLLGAYCGEGHYPQAPLCNGYDRPGLIDSRPDLFGGSGGASAPAAGSGGSGAGGAAGPAASGGRGGVGDAAGGGTAAVSARAGSGAGTASKSSSGGCTLANAGSAGSAGLLAPFGLVVAAWLSRRARRA
jgi:hypothetical protein